MHQIVTFVVCWIQYSWTQL